MSSLFSELEYATCDIIQIIKQIPELEHTRLSVIGGLAMWHYLPSYRPTNNINFITNISTSPSWMKKMLLNRPNASFIMRSQVLYYQSPSGREIQIDISPEWLSPYLPDSARNIRYIPYGEVPYISLTDLIVFKLDSSSLHSNLAKKERDARDAAALLEHEVGPLLGEDRPPLELTWKQIQIVKEALCDVVKCGAKEKSWWETHLGLSPTGSGLEYIPSEGGRRDDELEQRTTIRSRVHANSDPGTAWWYYERLDCAHRNRVPCSSSLRRNSTIAVTAAAISSTPLQDNPFSTRPGVSRSASYNGRDRQSTREHHHLFLQQQQQRPQRPSRFPAPIMTQPKTTNGNTYGHFCPPPSPRLWLRRPSLVSLDSGYSSSDCDTYVSGWISDDEREEETGRKKGAMRSGRGGGSMNKRIGGRARGHSDLSSCGSVIGGNLETVLEDEDERATSRRSVTFQSIGL
ncbi:hypothetical protein F4810DRAFT_421886 [Camillea tinctor]|nr:hypothetical protein F4810DRAFT_421886 [Camillea tinctor]